MALFVGADVSKEKLGVAARPTGEFWSVSNFLSPRGFPVAAVASEHERG